MLTQADIDAGTLVNTATADSGQTPPATDSVSVPARRTRPGARTRPVTPPTYDTLGETLSYSYVVTNTGNVTLTVPVTVTDDRATVDLPDRRCSRPGESLTCTATYTVTQADLDAGAVINTATATSGSNVTAAGLPPPRWRPSVPQLDLVKTAAPASYDAVDQVITYTYVVTNTSNVTLDGPFTVDDDRTTVTCPAVPTLAPGASITCTATYTITQADLDAGEVVNHATASGSFDGTPVSSDEATAVVDADARPGAAPREVRHPDRRTRRSARPSPTPTSSSTPATSP